MKGLLGNQLKARHHLVILSLLGTTKSSGTKKTSSIFDHRKYCHLFWFKTLFWVSQFLDTDYQTWYHKNGLIEDYQPFVIDIDFNQSQGPFDQFVKGVSGTGSHQDMLYKLWCGFKIIPTIRHLGVRLLSQGNFSGVFSRKGFVCKFSVSIVNHGIE